MVISPHHNQRCANDMGLGIDPLIIQDRYWDLNPSERLAGEDKALNPATVEFKSATMSVSALQGLID